jgi:tetratricopeptide (TPR) repeat protein
MKDYRRAEEAVLMGQNQNPLTLAKASLDRDDLTAAASHWERARALLPTAILKSSDSLDILLGLERYDEAEALMRERQKRFPRDRFCLIGLARIAEQRGPIEEALKRWEFARDRVSDSVDGYLGCVRCLLALGRLDEADIQCALAIRRDPHRIHAYLESARISDRRNDTRESLARWRRLAETFKYPPAFAFVSKAMAELGRADEAEAYLHEPFLLYPNDLEISVARAHFAQRRGDLVAACERWAVVRAIAPYFILAYHEGVQCLIGADRHKEADAVLLGAIERFPDEVWPLREFAQLAHNRKDWNEAVTRWESLRRVFPDEATGFVMGAQALIAAGRDHEAAVLLGQS